MAKLRVFEILTNIIGTLAPDQEVALYLIIIILLIDSFPMTSYLQMNDRNFVQFKRNTERNAAVVSLQNVNKHFPVLVLIRMMKRLAIYLNSKESVNVFFKQSGVINLKNQHAPAKKLINPTTKLMM